MKKQVRTGVINELALRSLANDRNIDPIEEFLEFQSEMKPSRQFKRDQRDKRKQEYRDKDYD